MRQASGGSRVAPAKFRPTNKKLEDLLDPDCLDDETRRMLVGQIMNPSPAVTNSNLDSSIKTESSLSFLERLCEAGGFNTLPEKQSPANPSPTKDEDARMPYPSMLRTKIHNGSEDLMASMATRLRDLEAKHHAYQCELKEMHDKYRQSNDMLQKARRQNEEHENTIVTLYEAKQDLENELNDIKSYLGSEGVVWNQNSGASKVMPPPGEAPGGGHRLGTGSPTPEEKKEPPKERFSLYNGDCAEDTFMDEASAEAVLAASGPRIFPNSAKQRGAQLYSRRREQPPEDLPPPRAAEDVDPIPSVDIPLLQRNAKILSDYVGWKHVVTDGNQGHIRDRDVVRVVIYKNGICVNNGPFRPFGWHLCEAFLQDLSEGYYPYEYKEKYPDGYPIEVTDKHDEECDPHKPSSKSSSAWQKDGGYQPVSKEQFLNKLPEKRITASGRVVEVRGAIAELMGCPPDVKIPREPVQHISKAQLRAQEAEPASNARAQSRRGSRAGRKASVVPLSSSSISSPGSPMAFSPKAIGREDGLVPFLIRMPSGQQVSMKLNPTDTIEVMREEFITAVPDFSHRSFELCQAYPPKTFVDHNKTLFEYGLTKGSALMVRILK